MTTFVNDVGLHLALSGCSKAALECGRAIGICCHPKTIRRFRTDLAKTSKRLTGPAIDSALQKKSLLLLITDDFHSVHTIQRPTSAETSVAIHMATSICDIHQSIPAISRSENSIHYQASSNDCTGAINTGMLIDHFSTFMSRHSCSSFLSSLPSTYCSLNVTNFHTTLLALR